MNKGLKSLLLLLLISMFAIGGCSKGDIKDNVAIDSHDSNEPVEFTLTMRTEWYKAGWQAVEKHINNNSNDLGFKIKIDKISGGSDGNQILKARFATGEMPDFIEQTSVYEHVLNYGGIDTIQEIDGEWVNNFPSDLLSSRVFSYDDKIYGMPIDPTQLVGVFYNKDVFKNVGVDVPTNWDEFLNVCETIKKAEITPVYYSGKDAWTTTMMVNEGFLREYNKIPEKEFYKLLNSGELKFVELELLKDTIIKSKDLIDMGYVQPTFLSDTYDNAQKALSEGNAAMMFQATWVMDEINAKYPELAKNIGAFAIPLEDDSRSSSFAPFTLMMTSQCQDKELGMKFLEYIGSKEIQQMFATAQPGLWTCNDLDIDLLPAVQDMKTWLDNGKVNVWYGNQMNYPQDITFADNMQAYYAGSQTPEGVLEMADKDTEKQAKAKADTNFK